MSISCHATAVAMAAALLWPAAVLAGGWGGGAGISTDKVVHGLSQTGGRPSLLLDLFYRGDTGWSASVGAATLPRGEHATPAELSFGVARAWQIDADWSSQLSATHYAYLGMGDARYRSYNEVGAALAWRGMLSLFASHSPNARGQSRDGQPLRGASSVLEAGVHVPLAGRWAVDLGLGWQDIRRIGGTEYSYHSAGIAWGQGPIQLSLSWISSRADERGRVPEKVAGDRWVGTASWSW